MDLTDGMDDPTIVEMPSGPQDDSNKLEIDWNDPVYQTIPKPLLDIMKANSIPEWLIRKVSSKYFPEDTPIANYSDDYVQHIMDCKDEVIQLARNYITLPF